MQLMPDTASKLSVKDVFDPQQNIEGGAKYLKQLLDKYKGDNKLALAAFNAGPAAVDAAAGVPDIPETRDYVDAILKRSNSAQVYWPAAKPEAQAHWKLKPPSCPVTSITSPMKYSPAQRALPWSATRDRRYPPLRR